MNPFSPTVLLGPGRGGTTLLYKLLSLHPQIAFLTNYDSQPLIRPFRGLALRASRPPSALRRWAWFSETGHAYLSGRAFAQRLVPMPVEGESIYAACGISRDVTDQVRPEAAHGFHDMLARIQRAHGAQTILLKRTANNRRIPFLETALPGARYVLLWRDGRAVTQSLLSVRWWLDHRVWWAGDQTPREMGLTRAQMVGLAARNWAEEAAAIEAGLKGVNPQRTLAVRYENLLARPGETLTAILSFLGLEADPGYLAQIDSIGLKPVKEKWRESFSAEEQQIIDDVAGAMLRHLGYSRG